MHEKLERFISNTAVIIAAIVTIPFAYIEWYRILPAWNIKDPLLMKWLVVTGVFLFAVMRVAQVVVDRTTSNVDAVRLAIYGFRTGVFMMMTPILLFVLFVISSLPIFNATAYASILKVQEGSTDDLPDINGSEAIALMDTDSAIMLGDREIGNLVDIVSQFDVSNNYTQINIGGRPVKVAPLTYASIIKWIMNRNRGVPGYISVDPVKMDADYVAMEEGMRYVPSAWFGDNLYRRQRRKFRTKMFDEINFEVDDDGKPYFVTPTFTKSVGMYGGKVITGAIISDPVTGEMEWYAAADVPEWVDVLYSGDLISQQFDYGGMLKGGYLNSILAQTGCRQVTDNYGYVAKGTDIYIYTGVTSANADASNIGFVLANERTGETKFIQISGANEASAMAAAEGEVQEKNYTASFPSLIRTESTPTYIMVLKDKAGLVKMYAAVNVEQYNMVATATNQKDCLKKYAALVAGRISGEEAVADAMPGGLDGAAQEDSEVGAAEATVDGAAAESADDSTWENVTITVTKKAEIVEGGDTWLYIVTADRAIYKAKYADVIPMILVEEGDETEIAVNEKGVFKIP